MLTSEAEVEWVKSFFSVPRFAPYVQSCGGDESAAVRLYWWNVEASAAFYAALHCLEIVLRNALHEELTLYYARSDWWTTARPAGDGTHLITDAYQKLRRTNGRPPNEDDIVAAMPFGFWVSLTSRSNEAAMWRPALYRAFRPGYRRSRREMYTHLNSLRLFRNRIMHHEPIHMRHLEADLHRVCELAEYLAPGVTKILARVSTIERVLARRPTPSSGGRRRVAGSGG
ncbi:hypothetical protein M1L60_08080 [Actinoplanes sp. TRM 88003]|uniref:Abi-like protein n=1 Tax=Paractinoplanes aksuensis TaxID=2939490 RepID=A0ABT1DIE2_9ACTN|nr:hypothetical protein [Actinoplanes aksuensis]MCO8270554.1 hypothetical protein [Actinoplanes aksuensis]